MRNQGSVELGILVGLLVGSAMLWINSGKRAQELADAQGREVSQWEAVQEAPGKSVLTVIGPGVAGAGVGWALEELSGSNDKSSSQRNNSVEVSGNEGTVNISISGDQENTSSTRTDTRTDTSAEGSYNQ